MSIRAGGGRRRPATAFDAGRPSTHAAFEGPDGSMPRPSIPTPGHARADASSGGREVGGGVAASRCSDEGIAARHESSECDHAAGVMSPGSDTLEADTHLLFNGHDPGTRGAAAAD